MTLNKDLPKPLRETEELSSTPYVSYAMTNVSISRVWSDVGCCCSLVIFTSLNLCVLLLYVCQILMVQLN